VKHSAQVVRHNVRTNVNQRRETHQRAAKKGWQAVHNEHRHNSKGSEKAVPKIHTSPAFIMAGRHKEGAQAEHHEYVRHASRPGNAMSVQK